ncbi:SUMF1/EgtB/PvdO family nonheme iron enzyme [Vibrio fluvialis]|nr:SUMF1/EgtB/PvdO family nonheme iron enzyme [Vibrio fluvialis]
MRHRLPALLLALSPIWVSASVYADEVTQVDPVTAIDEKISTKQSEIDSIASEYDAEGSKLQQLKNEQSRLQRESDELDAKRNRAKSALDKQYSRLLEDPDTDLVTFQKKYQESWSAVKENQSEALTNDQAITESEMRLSQIKQKQARLKTEFANLEESKIEARVKRLDAELRESDVLETSYKTACSTTMTLGECSSQGQHLTKQKAVKQFQAWLIDETSEAAVVKQHLADVSLNIHVLKHTTTDSGFYDGSKFKTVIDTQLDARPAENTPCKLLNVDSQYCFAPGENAQTSKQKEVAWVNLAIRSNQYNDKVSVDGVSYGSTPVEIMLPVGNHMITVEKEGYRSFHQELSINSDHTLRAVLREQANILKQGFKFADSLKGNIKAPEMITLVSGEYLLGENASRQVRLDHAFAVSATPITVGEFETFVNQTGYQTDAELQNVCIAVNNSEVTPIPDSYWRNPGFKQSAQSPAVCISQNDANAYAHWLSKQTGFTYRLPSEDEWEVAARSGSKTSYWWGDNFGSGQANTGWGGTPWSNKSTSPVRSFEPNRLGFYDVVGNVWQWTNDARGLAKGGAWSFSPEMAKAESELFISPSAAANYVGFRILREL